ncbi:MFS transporter [Leptolyngbya sp. 'hensonii']|uniref:MFS transporter n=1 Tax=Leptolyngbya sp. 'hensonii' TaxID=1922337 RepID=UPI00094F55BE|nr:MFS transporter [Leptolyngbya sp. 'hensonii']OLP18112.1 MFS transporter [Leptolyngbya sp. 'hensonii']
MNNSVPAEPPLPERGRLPFTVKLAYGAGDLGAAITANVTAIYALVFFTNVAGLNPGLAGSVLLLGKIWDAVNDPIVGVLSDRTQSRWGRRYPWMIFGAIPFGLVFVLQWIVPQFDQWGLFWYYVLIGVLFNTFYTAVNLPYTALTPELTQDYDERTSLNSFRFTFSIGGSILSLILALGTFSLLKVPPAQQYLTLAIVAAIISVLPLYWCFFGTRRYAVLDSKSDDTASIPYFEQVRIAFTNGPFLFVVGIYLCSWLALQNTVAVIPYFVKEWMQLRQDQWFTAVIAMVQVVALATLFVWSLVSARVGKKGTYFMGMGLWILAQAGLFFLQPGQISLMFLLAVMAGFGVSTAYLVPWSMIPDVIELDELKTGQRREGIFYGYMVLLQKIGLAIGLFLVGQALQWSGFIKPTAELPVPVQPDSALLAIRLMIGPIPTVILLGGLILAYFYPLSREVHAEILLQLQARKEAERGGAE